MHSMHLNAFNFFENKFSAFFAPCGLLAFHQYQCSWRVYILLSGKHPLKNEFDFESRFCDFVCCDREKKSDFSDFSSKNSVLCRAESLRSRRLVPEECFLGRRARKRAQPDKFSSV